MAPHGTCEAGRVGLPVPLGALSPRKSLQVPELRWELTAWVTAPRSLPCALRSSVDC